MVDLATLTAELPDDVSAKLACLARRTGRDSSTLVGAAVVAYVDRELAIVEHIEQGLADMHAGRVYSTDEGFAGADAIIREARATR